MASTAPLKVCERWMGGAEVEEAKREQKDATAYR